MIRSVVNLARALVQTLPPAWRGYRGINREALSEQVIRPDTTVEVLHPERVVRNLLPRNVVARDALPADRGWWGYSMRDVPERLSTPTRLVTLRNATVLPFLDPEVEYFRPALLSRQAKAIELREISFRPMHGAQLRQKPEPVRLERATWVCERVYDNHSHWLTAHLPKLVLLRDRPDLLVHTLLPERLTPVMDASIRTLGLDPVVFPRFETGRPLHVETLTLFDTDRFRPELLCSVRRAIVPDGIEPHRRVFVSRARAARRRLANEADVWPLFEQAGFERVFLETLTFDEQVRLMAETRVLAAPHGAGLTNMMFCPEGTHVIEIADLSFPNPNFYALASAMGLPYWLVSAESRGDVHPLEKDLWVEPTAVVAVLEALPIRPASA